MNITELITFIIVLVFATILIVLSLLQKMHKGIPLNNKYIYASKEDKETMNKDLLYTQSSITFFLLGLMLLLVLLSSILDTKIFFYLDFILIFILVLYLIYSEIMIYKDKNKK